MCYLLDALAKDMVQCNGHHAWAHAEACSIKATGAEC
jgi:hypothetical protein